MLTRIDHGPIAELRLDRPPANALSPELVTELRGAVVEAAEAGARALVLSGREGMFSAGLDVPRFLALDRDGVKEAWRELFALFAALARSPIPVAAAITGHGPAGGCALALFCDHRVMAAGDYRIGLNEVQVGVRMPRPIHAAAVHVVGTRQAERLCASAVLMGPDEALRIGLVDELAPADQVVERAVAWSQRMIELPRDAVRKTRAIARRGLVVPFERMDDEQLELFVDEWLSAETQGALRALVERLAQRQPR